LGSYPKLTLTYLGIGTYFETKKTIKIKIATKNKILKLKQASLNFGKKY
jgi:hypothetical protein